MCTSDCTCCARSQANSVCCEDNADAATHHELLLPGHLLCKFLKDKLNDSLEVMLSLIRRDMGVRQNGQVSKDTQESRGEKPLGFCSHR